jgi:hypothetical protein
MTYGIGPIPLHNGLIFIAFLPVYSPGSNIDTSRHLIVLYLLYIYLLILRHNYDTITCL